METTDWQLHDNDEEDVNPPQESSAETFSNAWKGGPKPSTSSSSSDDTTSSFGPQLLVFASRTKRSLWSYTLSAQTVSGYVAAYAAQSSQLTTHPRSVTG